METIETAQAASALADRLNGADRDRPVVVVTTPSGSRDPWIDAAEIERQLGALAEVILMPTGPNTWSFSNKMPPLTQVFGGAGRVYPPGHAWVANPKVSPLRFAYRAEEGPAATSRLIDDAMEMAAVAGRSDDRRKTRRARLEGVVARVVADRALIKLPNGRLGNVSPALAVPGVPVAQALTEGQPVTGWLDEDHGWFDVREMMLAPHDALAGYQAGDIVLAEVGEVSADVAEVFLHPLVHVEVGRAQVTGATDGASGDGDDLRTLMTRGEVVPARVLAAHPGWRVSLWDVDEDEPHVPAASLLRGGPPWLERTSSGYDPGEDQAPVPPVEEDDVPRPDRSTADPVPAVQRPAEAVKPDPRWLDPGRRLPPDAGPAGTPATAPSGGPEVAKLLRDREAQRAAADELRAQVDGLRQEVRMLRQERSSLDSRNHHLERQLADQRSRLRKAKRATVEGSRPVFADAEQGFRYAVLTAWATRTPSAEQEAVPLPAFHVGPAFIDSLLSLEGIGAQKVADVVYEIVTGRAKDLTSRELRQYRESEGAASPTVTRQHDGAVMWRVNLQTNTASARRLHFWRLPGGDVELCHVGTHDERPPT